MSSLVITKQTGNFFSLVLDSGDAIISEQNRLTTIGNFCNFKTANGANLVLKQNILYSEITIITGVSHVPTSVNDLWISLLDAGFFDGLGGGGSITPTRFTDLLDTFTSYIGKDGQILVVNESEQKIETIAISLFTEADKTKLDGIETGAQVNVQSDVNETNPDSPAYIKNFPDFSNIGIFSKRYAGSGQTYTLPVGAVASIAYIDGYVQYPLDETFPLDLNVFEQSGVDVTFATTIETGSQILINYYL